MTSPDSSKELDQIMLRHMQYTGWNGHVEAKVYQIAKQEILAREDRLLALAVQEAQDKAVNKLLVDTANKVNKEYGWHEVDNWIFAYGSELRDKYITLTNNKKGTE